MNDEIEISDGAKRLVLRKAGGQASAEMHTKHTVEEMPLSIDDVQRMRDWSIERVGPSDDVAEVLAAQRSEPPPGYELLVPTVTYDGYIGPWRWVVRGGQHAERPGAVAEAWAHYDTITAPLRAEVERLRAQLEEREAESDDLTSALGKYQAWALALVPTNGTSRDDGGLRREIEAQIECLRLGAASAEPPVLPEGPSRGEHWGWLKEFIAWDGGHTAEQRAEASRRLNELKRTPATAGLPEGARMPSLGSDCILEGCGGHALAFGVCPMHLGEAVARMLPSMDAAAFSTEREALHRLTHAHWLAARNLLALVNPSAPAGLPGGGNYPSVKSPEVQAQLSMLREQGQARAADVLEHALGTMECLAVSRKQALKRRKAAAVLPEGARWEGKAIVLADGTRVSEHLDSRPEMGGLAVVVRPSDGRIQATVTRDEAIAAAAVLTQAEGTAPPDKLEALRKAYEAHISSRRTGVDWCRLETAVREAVDLSYGSPATSTTETPRTGSASG